MYTGYKFFSCLSRKSIYVYNKAYIVHIQLQKKHPYFDSYINILMIDLIFDTIT
jgi:hypothetical protein